MKNLVLKIMEIKGNFKALINDIRGGAMTILLLFLLPILLFIFISRAEETRILRATNVTLENAVEEAARYGAMMIDPNSQAKGKFLIAYNRAIPMIEEQLKAFMGLDDDFRGDSDITSFSNIQYQGIVYNGVDGIEGYKYEDYLDDYYEANELACMVKFFSYEGMEIIDKNTGDAEIFTSTTFYISDDYGITDYPLDESVKVTMNAPGVLLFVKATVNPVIVNQEDDAYKETVARWAYAKVVKRK